jgi:hypothetical protein
MLPGTSAILSQVNPFPVIGPQISTTLNLTDRISNFRTAAIFVIINTEEMFHTETVGTVTKYRHKMFTLAPAAVD